MHVKRVHQISYFTENPESYRGRRCRGHGTIPASCDKIKIKKQTTED